LQYCIHLGSLDAVERCLSQRGPSRYLYGKNFLQQTALHISINKPKILTFLLSAGFAEIVDVCDREGTTPLMYAAAQGETQSVLELLRNGADYGVQDHKNMLYTDYAMLRGRFDLFTDIFNFYSVQNNSSLAQWTLDTALYCYLRDNEFRMVDVSLAGLRNFVRLGATLDWTTKKGNTALHFVKFVEQATLLLEYDAVPKDYPNIIGHTPLMVLTWFQDVTIVRKLVQFGASVNKRDIEGHAALEHALLASQKDSYWAFGDTTRHHESWSKSFEVAVELLSAGADPGNTDHCKCSCSTHGCTLVRYIFPQIYCDSGRICNLVGTSWMIELFIVLERLQSTSLAVLIQSLYRRQRFDELGLTHTCCLAQENPYDARYDTPYQSALDVECEHGGSVMMVDTLDLSRIEELADEEEELRGILETDCERFMVIQEFPYSDEKTALLEILSRRAAFIKCGMEEATRKASVRVQPVRNKARAWQHVSELLLHFLVTKS
jgi:ankyrin repeat protein